MATIAQTWNNATPAGSDSISAGDDKIRELKSAVQERAQNGGVYFPDASADANSGVPFISPSALVANEWNVFDKTGSVPDPARKLINLTQTTMAVHSAVALNVAGTLSEAGSRVIAKSGTKRMIVLGASGDARQTQPTDERLLLRKSLIYVPQLNSGGGAIVGSLKEVVAVAETAAASPAEDVSFDVKRQAGSGWSSDAITTVSFTSVMAAATTLKILSGATAARVDTAAGFSGAAFPTIAGGDIFQVVSNRTGNNTFFASVWLVIEVDWP